MPRGRDGHHGDSEGVDGSSCPNVRRNSSCGRWHSMAGAAGRECDSIDLINQPPLHCHRQRDGLDKSVRIGQIGVSVHGSPYGEVGEGSD